MRHVTKVILTLAVFDAVIIGGAALTYHHSTPPVAGISNVDQVNQGLADITSNPVVIDTTGAAPTHTNTPTKSKTNSKPKNSQTKTSQPISQTISPKAPTTPAASPSIHQGIVLAGSACPPDEHGWAAMSTTGTVHCRYDETKGWIWK